MYILVVLSLKFSSMTYMRSCRCSSSSKLLKDVNLPTNKEKERKENHAIVQSRISSCKEPKVTFAPGIFTANSYLSVVRVSKIQHMVSANLLGAKF